MSVVEYASVGDVPFLCRAHPKASESMLADQVERREVLVARVNDQIVGWLRFVHFWDTLPLMRELHVLGPHRGCGIGRALVEFWEGEMRCRGHTKVMTSTMSSETAQGFYRKLGYTDVGGFVLPGEALELMLYKSLA